MSHDVVIAGGGPTGLMLGAELALAGVDVQIVERRTNQAVDGSRAGGLHARTLEMLDLRGVAERFVAEGAMHPAVAFAQQVLPVGDFPTRHPYVLALWQSHIERILADWVLGELGVPIERGTDVVGLQQDDDGVDVALSDGRTLRTRYLVGCDGGRSRVRKEAGIAFEGWDATTSWMIAEVELDGEPRMGFHHDARGTHAIGRRQPDEPIRLVLTEAEAEHEGLPDLEELRAALVSIYGSDFGLRSATWISRFSDAARQAAAYRSGRVLLAGDAAHVHPPHGGQGLNTGVQDAMNLGWKLARVVRGAPDALLDSYHAERHPVGARVLQNTMVQVTLQMPDDRHRAVRDTLGGLMDIDAARQRIAGMLTGLDIRYDLGEGHPLLGRRVPDLDLHTADGPTRVSTLLHGGTPVLLVLDGSGPFDTSAWPDVRAVEAVTDGPWELPVLGPVDAPAAVLVRPDGHVAFAGSPSDPALSAALDRWFAPERPAHPSR